MLERFSIVQRFVFPAPWPPTYKYNDFPQNLLWLPRSDGTHVGVLMLRCEQPTDRVILYAHGNGEDLGLIGFLLLQYAQIMNAHVLAFEYSGYGYSGRVANADNINADITLVYSYITQDLKVPPSQLYLYGRSVGGGPSTWLAAQLSREGVKLGGLILQSTFRSIRSLAKELAGKVVGSIVSERWSNITNIAGVTCPVFFIHGKKDTLISYAHSLALHEACTSLDKQLLLCDGADHNSFDELDHVIRPVTEFMERTIAISAASADVRAAEAKAMGRHRGSSGGITSPVELLPLKVPEQRVFAVPDSVLKLRFNVTSVSQMSAQWTMAFPDDGSDEEADLVQQAQQSAAAPQAGGTSRRRRSASTSSADGAAAQGSSGGDSKHSIAQRLSAIGIMDNASAERVAAPTWSPAAGGGTGGPLGSGESTGAGAGAATAAEAKAAGGPIVGTSSSPEAAQKPLRTLDPNALVHPNVAILKLALAGDDFSHLTGGSV